MPDPTAPVLATAFCSALGIFTAAAVTRWLKHRRQFALEMEPATVLPAGQDLIIGAPEAHDPYGVRSIPPPIPPPLSGSVPTWPYLKLDFLWAGFIFLIFSSLSLANATVDPAKIQYDAGTLLGSIGFHLTLAIITTLVVVWRIKPVPWLGLRWPKWPWVFLIAPCTVIAMWMVFGTLQLAGYMKWMESLGVDAVQDSVKLLQTATDPTVLILMAVAAVLVAPVCEELVFRGYLYPVMKKFAGPWVAAICSGLIFAAAHGSLAALLPLFIFGIVLAVLYEKTGSIWAPMAVHFCFNGATVGLQTLVRHFPQLLEQAK